MKPTVSFVPLVLAVSLGCSASTLAQTPGSPTGGTAALGALPARVDAPPAYEPRGRRDPFESIEALHAEMTAPTVASAKLKGILRGASIRVLVETSDGLGYILKVGDTLGDGRLVEIGANNAVFMVPARQGTTARIVLRLSDD